MTRAPRTAAGSPRPVLPRVGEGHVFAIRGALLLDGSFAPGALVVERGKITDILAGPSPSPLPAPVYEADLVCPGLIDLQVNGGFGVEIGEDPEAIRHLAARLPATGVTAFLPTLLSSGPEFYAGALAALRAARVEAGALPLGLHAEGPFLSPERPGAHPRAAIERAKAGALDVLVDSGALRLVTVAPERPGALELIRRLRERDIAVSLGHTNATYEQFVRGVDHGATFVTHLYSAMSPLHHRAPGAVGAALVDDRVTVALIADGVHCAAAALRLALAAKGPGRVALVTDAIAGAGTAGGTCELYGRTVVTDDQGARLADGTLAGSTLTLDRAVQNLVRLAGASTPDACRAASEVPARVLGLARKGALVVGYDADIVLLDERMEVQATFVGGRLAYDAGDDRG